MPVGRDRRVRLDGLDGEVAVVGCVVAGVFALVGPPGLSLSLFPPRFRGLWGEG